MGRPETISCKVAQELAIEQRVEFTGPMESHETIRRIGGSRLLTHPSYDDSGGSAVVEALAQGVPVLSLDIVGPHIPRPVRRHRRFANACHESDRSDE
jgi:glycosyltransferase involved in cell wall biosynthesis